MQIAAEEARQGHALSTEIRRIIDEAKARAHASSGELIFPYHCQAAGQLAALMFASFRKSDRLTWCWIAAPGNVCGGLREQRHLAKLSQLRRIRAESSSSWPSGYRQDDVCLALAGRLLLPLLSFALMVLSRTLARSAANFGLLLRNGSDKGRVPLR